METEQQITINKDSAISVLDKILNTGLLATIFLLPILIFPFTTDWFEAPKQVFLVFATGLLTVCFFLKSALKKQLTLVNSHFDLPIIGLLAVFTISSLLTPNKLFDLSGVILTLFPLTLLYFLVVNIFKTEVQIKKAISVLAYSATLISLLTFAQFVFKIIGGIPPLAKVLTPGLALISARAPVLPVIFSPAFSLTGSLFTQELFLIILLPLVFIFSHKKITVPLVAIIITLVLTLVKLFVDRPVLLDPATSWRIATGTLGQTLQTALFGVGITNYVNAFSLFKPLDFNATPLWNLRFNTGNSYPLTILTTGGMAALAAFIYLLIRFFRFAKTRLQTNLTKSQETTVLLTLAIIIAILFLFPAPFAVLFMFYLTMGLLISFYQSQEITALAWENKSLLLSSPKIPYVGLVVSLLIILPVFYLIGRVFLADIFFNQAAVSAVQNRGADTYNLQIRAIALNPYNDVYRVAYSQTNLALADALAGQTTGPDKTITDQQRATIVQLVQQAIRESRNAVALNPDRAGNWENLSAIYRSLINFAQGADQWAVTSQNQAITLDPTNPRLRLDLGGIFFSLQNYTAASQAFSMATTLKNDYPNAHYNLAQAYKKLDNNTLAQQELLAVKNLVCDSLTGTVSPTLTTD
ncbi:MAG: tetratricopeptide repeat protein, partial [Patescibacteria group bacterium]